MVGEDVHNRGERAMMNPARRHEELGNGPPGVRAQPTVERRRTMILIDVVPGRSTGPATLEGEMQLCVRNAIVDVEDVTTPRRTHRGSIACVIRSDASLIAAGETRTWEPQFSVRQSV